MNKKLYTFRFKDGGFNQTYALEKKDVITEVKVYLGNYADEIDPESITLVKDEQAYWDSFPLMD